jgi:hypothetical protein
VPAPSLPPPPSLPAPPSLPLPPLLSPPQSLLPPPLPPSLLAPPPLPPPPLLPWMPLLPPSPPPPPPPAACGEADRLWLHSLLQSAAPREAEAQRGRLEAPWQEAPSRIAPAIWPEDEDDDLAVMFSLML